MTGKCVAKADKEEHEEELKRAAEQAERDKEQAQQKLIDEQKAKEIAKLKAEENARMERERREQEKRRSEELNAATLEKQMQNLGNDKLPTYGAGKGGAPSRSNPG